jgi:hypothetical protein
VPDNSTGGFGVNQQDVNEAASLMSNLTSSGSEVTKALGVLDPLVFGVIGSSTGIANAGMEDAVLQCLQGVLNLFSNSSSDVQAAVSNFGSADSAVAGSLSSLAEADTSASIPNIADEMPSVLAVEDSLPGGGFALSAFAGAGIPAEDIAYGTLAAEESMSAGLESSVLARLAGTEEMLGELAGGVESDLMSLFRSVSGDPSEVSERWNGLTEDEQDEVVLTGRDTIGSLDGIPTEVRNLVNTGDLEDLITETEGQIKDLRDAAVQADEDHDNDEEKALLCLQEAAILQVQLGGLQALKGQLQAHPNAYLLAVGTNPNGSGCYILAINNPDTADNVATLVPTVRTGLIEGTSGISRYVTAALNLVGAAGEASRDPRTSVVIWANYSVPLLAETGAASPEAQAAPLLGQFQGGLYSTNVNGAHLHTTVIGNGTGSVLIGEAAKLPGCLSAEDVIALGRPGLDADMSAAFSSHAGSSAHEGGSHVWLYADESDGKGPAAGMDYFSPTCHIMPDMGHIIVGNYENIYYLEKQ